MARSRLQEDSIFRRVMQALKTKEKDESKQAPFNLPPSQYTQEIFRLVNPFVESFEGSEHYVDAIKNVDKVNMAMEAPMDLSVLSKIVGHMLVSSCESRMVSPPARSELGFRDIHVSLIRPLARLAKFNVPRRERLTFREKRATERSTGTKRKAMATAEENEGFYIQLDPLENETDPTGMELLYEVDGDGDTSRFDIKALIHDKRIKVGNDLVTVANAECKKNSDDLPSSLSQAAVYSKTDVLGNMQKGRYSPIFLYALAKQNWRYGLLLPYGVVTVKNGKVTNVKSTNEHDTKETMQEILDMSTVELRKKYPKHKTYPDGDYLSGLVYYDARDFSLPSDADDCNPKHVCLFYQAWLQIILGNDVIKWTVNDVQGRLDEWNARIQAKCDAVARRILNLDISA